MAPLEGEFNNDHLSDKHIVPLTRPVIFTPDGTPLFLKEACKATPQSARRSEENSSFSRGSRNRDNTGDSYDKSSRDNREFSRRIGRSSTATSCDERLRAPTTVPRTVARAAAVALGCPLDFPSSNFRSTTQRSPMEDGTPLFLKEACKATPQSARRTEENSSFSRGGRNRDNTRDSYDKSSRDNREVSSRIGQSSTATSCDERLRAPTTVPRTVARAAAVALGCPLDFPSSNFRSTTQRSPMEAVPIPWPPPLPAHDGGTQTGGSTGSDAGRPPPLSACPTLRRPFTSTSVTSEGISRRRELARRANDALALIPADLVREQRHPDVLPPRLEFGDILRLRLEQGQTLLSSVPENSSELERHLQREQRRAGRRLGRFRAISLAASTVSEDKGTPHRSVWQLYRANPLDGFQGQKLHYGQCFRLGQRSADPTDPEEFLLAVAPPAEGGGARAAYEVFATSRGHGSHTSTEDEDKAFDDVWRLMPCLTAAGEEARNLPSATSPSLFEGELVDPTRPVLLLPVGPAARLHDARLLSPRGFEPSTSGTKVSQRPRSIAVELCDGGQVREQLVEASAIPLHVTGRHPASWRLEVLDVPEDAVRECERKREEAHRGLARGLLGRALPTPPESVGAGARSSVAAKETNFSRWDHLRTVLLTRLGALGALGVSKLRKALNANRHIASGIDVGDNLEARAQDSSEAGSVPLEQVDAGLRIDFKIQVSKEDLALLLQSFSIRGTQKEWLNYDWDRVLCLVEKHQESGGRGDLLDVDLMVDVLRGTPSPGRTRMVWRLYERLQKEARIASSTALPVGWLERRLTLTLREESGLRLEELMNALPLVRSHSSITRADFVRWMLDVTFKLPTHSAFLQFLKQVWGPLPDFLSEEEARLWNLRTKPPPPPTPHMPPFGMFHPVIPGYPFEAVVSPGDRGDGPIS